MENNATDVVETSEREDTIRIYVGSERWTIDEGDIKAPGINLGQAATRRADFAKALLAIGDMVNSQASSALKLSELPDNPAALIEKLQEVLTLKDDAAYRRDLEDKKYNLELAGRALYGSLTTDMKDALAELDFWATPEDKGVDPPLYFILEGDQDAVPAPVCWNMIYQADEADTDFDWRGFWGFRIPITQWVKKRRKREIPVRSALIAIDAKLHFAQKEQEVVRHFVDDHESISGRFQRYASAWLSEQSEPGEVDTTWMQQHEQDTTWLAQFLTKARGGSRRWKDVALNEIFVKGDPYGLVHFACHCQPHENPYNGRQLQIQVGGELIEIDSTRMKSHLNRYSGKRLGKRDDGPIVFINACTSAQQDPGAGQLTNQFPEMPYDWISSQGATAVIATICDVPDIFACAFATKFYDTLFSALREYRTRQRSHRAASVPRNLYLAEALLDTRKFFLEKFNNPLGLAYELYASRDARLDLVGGVEE